MYDKSELPKPDEDQVCAGCPSSGPDDCAKKCSTYEECKSWTLRKDTNECWLFSSTIQNTKVDKGAEDWVYGKTCKSLGIYFIYTCIYI